MIADLQRRVVDRVDYPYRLDPLNWVRGGRAFAALLSHPDGSGHGALVRFDGPSITVDTSQPRVQNESSDGTLRCLESPDIFTNPYGTQIFLQGTAPGADSVQMDNSGIMCRFSPDGRFMSWNNADGLFVAATGAGQGGRVRVAPPGAGEGRWSADGHRIFYRNASSWYVVSAPTADLMPVDQPRLLFSGRFLQALASWDRGPDGRSLLLLGEPPLRTTRLSIITGFPQYLEQKLGRVSR